MSISPLTNGGISPLGGGAPLPDPPVRRLNADRTDSVELLKNAEATDELLLAAVRDASQQIADRVVNIAFPAKVLSKTDKQITINRGDSTGVEVGQLWEVMSQGKTLIDPDTGDVLGREEALIGRARVIAVQPKFCTAELIEGVDNFL